MSLKFEVMLMYPSRCRRYNLSLVISDPEKIMGQRRTLSGPGLRICQSHVI